MVNKLIKVFYDYKGYPFKDQERQVRYPIVGNDFLGASNTTKIRFYIKELGSYTDTWVANSKLPNGKLGNEILETKGVETINGIDEDYVELSFSSYYTQAKGEVYISLNSFYGGVEIDTSGDVPTIVGNPTIHATGSIKISVYYATPLIDGDEVDSLTLAQIFAYCSTKLDKDSSNYLKVIEDISDINDDTDNEEYFVAGDIVYDKGSDTFYLLSGEFPTLTYTDVEL